MQEKEKNVSTVKFLSVFGPKITAGEHFDPKDDTTDQRSPVNNPEALYEQFVVPSDIMEELDAEQIDDFDDDVYPYEDRSEMGEDIAEMSRLDLKKSQERYFAALQEKQKKAGKKPASEQGDVEDAPGD